MASRVASTKLIKKNIIEDTRSKLLNAPVKEREEFSMSEAIHQIADEITEVLNRGYSYDEVATMLNAGGMDIKSTTLRQYMTAIKRNGSKSKSRKKKNDSKKVSEDTYTEEKLESNSDEIISKSVAKSSKPSVKIKSTSTTSENTDSDPKLDKFVDMPDEL
jgi:hypothetical protein